jgi:DNA-binding FadR family transcriptional regulator
VTTRPPRPRLGSGESRQVKTALRVAREVVRDIVDQDLRAGTRLPGETELMEMYGVSRSSMREALRILETNGFITVRTGPGGGPVVSEVDPVAFGQTTALFLQMSRTTFAEVLESRLVMEPYMARIAAERRVPERLEELKSSLQRHQDFDTFDHKDYLSIVHEFHAVVAGSTGNGVLDLFGKALQSIVEQRVTSRRPASGRWRQVLAEHAAIGEAILDGDADRAEDLMRTHMVEFCASYKRRYGAVFDEVIDGD